VKAAVSDILAARSHDEGGLSKLVGWSLAAHIAFGAIAIFLPTNWLGTQAPPPEIIVISLGGAVGPRSTGTAPISGRQVDQEATRPTPPAPPAAARPDVMPAPASKPVPQKPTPPSPTPAPPAATTKPPVTGAKVQAGKAAADTGASGTADGLTIGGGLGGGDAVDLNNFDPEWTLKFKEALSRTWARVQPEVGFVVLRFTILRDGSVEGGFPQIQVLEKNVSFNLEMVSKRAVMNAKLPPLPVSHKEPMLIVRLRFDYEKR